MNLALWAARHRRSILSSCWWRRSQARSVRSACRLRFFPEVNFPA